MLSGCREIGTKYSYLSETGRRIHRHCGRRSSIQFHEWLHSVNRTFVNKRVTLRN